jgi:O-antigen/teichoic acid export membrane protein
MVKRVAEQARRPGIALFLRNIGVTFVFKALSLLMTLVVYVLCARELGVITWGQVALIGSVANILLIPLTFGLYNGIVKYVPVESEADSRELMGTALIANVALSALLAAVLLLSGPLVERLFGFPPSSWLPAVVLAMSINLYILTESFLRGRQQFFRLGLYKLLGSIVFLACALAALYLLGVKSLLSYVVPLIAQNLFFFFSALRGNGLRPLQVTKRALKKLFAYGFFIMLSWLVSTLLFTADLLLVAKFATEYELGVYSVYQNTIRSLCTILFHDVFAVVFLPMIAALNKRHVDRLLVKYAFPIGAVVWLGAGLVTVMLILFLGKSFPLDWLYVGLTSAGIAMNMMYLLFTSVISLDGARAARLTFLALLIPIPAVLLMEYLLVKHSGVIGGMIAVIALNAVLLIVFRTAVRWFYRFQSDPEKGVLAH